MMHKPMKRPNSRSGRSDDVRFEKKEHEVVAAVKKHATPACLFTYLTRPRVSSRSKCFNEIHHTEVKTKTMSAPTPMMRHNAAKATPPNSLEPLIWAKVMKANGRPKIVMPNAEMLTRKLPVCTDKYKTMKIAAAPAFITSQSNALVTATVEMPLPAHAMEMCGLDSGSSESNLSLALSRKGMISSRKSDLYMSLTFDPGGSEHSGTPSCTQNSRCKIKDDLKYFEGWPTLKPEGKSNSVNLTLFARV
mmetsp:Transcript_100188/g.289277  ORF Transcript_100188/g.289277 Transcript_100188/m.289277 type:complete len:248 (-) Transcript_100188:1044-1787(-)